MRKMLYLLNALIGLWIAVSPWALNFRTVEYAFYSSLISGLVVAGISVAAWLTEDKAVKTREHGFSGSAAPQAA